MPTVAITDDFLEAMEGLPRNVQRKARNFVTKFRENPTSSGINYEKIAAADPRVHTVRIGLDYRGIVLHPDEGDVYVLVYIGHHDEAMAWAAKKRFEIHPRTGALQVMTLSAIEEAKQVTANPETQSLQGLFSTLTRDQIFDLGVPDVLLPSVFALKNEEQLDRLAPSLPAESSEALYGLAAGIPYNEVVKEIERQLTKPDDIAAALKHPDTMRRMTVVDNDASLQSMLDAPLAKWRIFLHPTQRKLVNRHFNGPAKVTGGAGTGKTVVAMHRAVHLARNVHTGTNDRILFTTFTKNLAQVVGHHLKQLDAEAAERIAVRNLHSVAHEVLRQSGMNPKPLAEDFDIRSRWEDALTDTTPPSGLKDLDFYQTEYQNVVLAQGITNLEDYLVARRIGRKGRLARPDRESVWQVMMRFAELCEAAGELTYPMMVAKAADYLAKHRPLPYKAIIVDEGQDLTPSDWRFIRSLVPPGENDLFLVGDAHQRIYGTPTTLSRCGIDIRGRSVRLRINYRTTQEIRRWACGILDGLNFDDLDGTSERQDGYTSLLHGPNPQILRGANLDEQIDRAAKHIQQLLINGVRDHAICGTTPDHKTRTRVINGLKERGIAVYPLDQTVPNDQDPGVRIGTMHRVKGLEFAQVIMFDANLSAGDADDPRERCLYYVAATRARDGLMILTK